MSPFLLVLLGSAALILVAIIILCWIFSWFSSRPTRDKYENLKAKMRVLRNEEKTLVSDFEKRKKETFFMKRAFVDKAELESKRLEIRELEVELHRHSLKFDPEVIAEEKLKNEKSKASNEVIHKGLGMAKTAKDLYDFFSE